MFTKRNKELHNSFLDTRGMYILLKRRNLRYMKDNTRLYKMIRILRLQVKNSRPNPSTHFSLETLTEAEVSLQNPESIQVQNQSRLLLILQMLSKLKESRKVRNKTKKYNFGGWLKILQEEGFRWLRQTLKWLISHQKQCFRQLTDPKF